MGIQRLAADLGIDWLAKWLVHKQYESAIECSVSFEDMASDADCWLAPLPPRSYISMDRGNFLTESNGRVWEVRKRFTVRPRLSYRNTGLTLNEGLGVVVGF